jgi:FkbM family methyltransferase
MSEISQAKALKAHSQYLVDCHGINVTNNIHTHQFVKTKTASPFDMSVYPVDKDKVISKRIVDDGCWECHIVKLVTDAREQHPKSFLVDIGGNIGMFANSAAAMGQNVFVFEPLQTSYDHICRTVEKNGFHDRLNLFRVAATRSLTKVQIHNFARQNMGGTLTRVIDDQQLDGEEGVDFAVGIPIDSVRDVFPRDRPAILKIDVEGNEIEALMGAKDFLQTADIILAVMELRPPVLGKPDTDFIFQIFSEKGLKPMLNNNGTLIPMEGDPSGWEKQFNLQRLFDMAWVRP